MMSDTDLRYPIGPFQFVENPEPHERRSYLEAIATAPAALRRAVTGLSDDQLDTPYRPGGWTLRQVVHHVPDSHMNSYVRFKLALTEEVPTVKPYSEAAWASLSDARGKVEPSLSLLESLHIRWLSLLESLSEQDWQRTFFHPEAKRRVSLAQNLSLYAWHGKHHIAHIHSLRARKAW